MTCAICLAPQVRPRVSVCRSCHQCFAHHAFSLDCGHVFCEACLVELHKNRRVKSILRCPTCRCCISLERTPPPCYPICQQAEAWAMANDIPSLGGKSDFLWPPVETPAIPSRASIAPSTSTSASAVVARTSTRSHRRPRPMTYSRRHRELYGKRNLQS